MLEIVITYTILLDFAVFRSMRIAAGVILLVVASCRAQSYGVGESKIWTEGCWKDAYGRGVGTVPDSCPGAQKDGALCYPFCESGYTGVGPVCWQNCPSGFRDDGAFCFKPDAYGRGAGYTSEGACASKHSQGCEKYGLLWYPKCAPNFYAFGCCICSPVCPAGMTDIGISCAKRSYGRGAGSPMKCAEGKDYDAGLCYPKCRDNFYGIGPVCWSYCPAKNWVHECAALCLTDQVKCDDKVKQSIKDAIQVFLQALATLNNPTEDEVKKLLKDTLNALLGYAYPLCSEVA